MYWLVLIFAESHPYSDWIRGILGGLVIGAVFGGALVMVYLERKFLGDIQSRIGPNRVGGRYGVLQLIADAIKLFTKEDIIPANADKWLFIGAPIVALTSGFLMVAVLPFDYLLINGSYYAVNVTRMDISILYLEAVSGLAVFAIFMAGWGSGSKYSMLGGFRNIAKMIGYEIPLGVSIISVAIMAQSLDIVEIVEAQDFLWNIMIHPLAFIVFGICLVADVGRIPFDQTESEEEIIAGWATEYSGMRWGLAFFAEYLHAVVGSFMVALIFLGGWNGLPIVGNLYIPGIFWLIIKTIMVIMFFIWTRGALPRYRIDQVVDLGWKCLLPLSLLCLVWSTIIGLVFG
ncbi:MAG: NADH-quinone oxidoreductase subunit NuoH [Methanosarcinales archaeon]|nr:NADH-quinone oxidoreductase subunit NuoH [Methanosarcinales archaeon]